MEPPAGSWSTGRFDSSRIWIDGGRHRSRSCPRRTSAAPQRSATRHFLGLFSGPANDIASRATNVTLPESQLRGVNVGSDRAGQARRSRWWQPRPGKRLVIGVGALALTAGMCLTPVAAGTAQAASAPAGPAGELKAGSAHAILNAHDQLAMPLPRLASDFSVKRNANGSATVGFALTYGVANTKSSKRVRADDATVVVRVARQAGSTGPPPADPVVTKVF